MSYLASVGTAAATRGAVAEEAWSGSRLRAIFLLVERLKATPRVDAWWCCQQPRQLVVIVRRPRPLSAALVLAAHAREERHYVLAGAELLFRVLRRIGPWFREVVKANWRLQFNCEGATGPFKANWTLGLGLGAGRRLGIAITFKPRTFLGSGEIKRVELN